MLITRPKQGSDAFAAALERAGAIPVYAPLIRIEPPDDPARAERAIRDARQYDWIVFSSANGVAGFFELLDARREDARLLARARIACVGPATAAALRARNIYPDLTPARYVAEDLAAALLAASAPDDRILLLRAQQARDVLPERLRAAQRIVDDVAVYKTVAVRDETLGETIRSCDVVTFASGSAVHAFIENAPWAALQSKIVACIGPVTAQAARDAGIRVDAVASEHTAGGLAGALEAHLSAAWG